jgi:hypothetical protein
LDQCSHDSGVGERFDQALHYHRDAEQSKVTWDQKPGHQGNLDDARSRGQGIAEDQPEPASQNLFAQSSAV